MFNLHEFNIHRRSFIKTCGSGAAITLTITSLPSLLMANKVQANELALDSHSLNWAPTPGKADFRIDGLSKVLGNKVFARDFRSKDLTRYGWPDNTVKEERVVYALRTNTIESVISSYNLDMLPSHLQPLVVVDATKIAKSHIDLSGDVSDGLFVRLGESALYYGQPVAMLIFKNAVIFRKAKKILQFSKNVIQYANKVSLQESKTYEPTYDYVKDESVNFSYVAKSADEYNDNYRNVQNDVFNEMASKVAEGDWKIYSRAFETQVMDPMFMEPESGLAWFNQSNNSLNLLLGTQSPTGDIKEVAKLFSDKKCAFKVKAVDLISCYPGGGFGGRYKSYFTLYLAVVAPFADGHPVLWHHDRFEQFQIGIKRHQTWVEEAIYLNKLGKIKALSASFTLDGGGRKNSSPYVAQLAALSSCSAYKIPKAIAKAQALDTPHLIGGAQRGFGGPQAFLAIETLLDEAAIELKIDPIVLRRNNLLSKTDTIVTGGPIVQDLQLEPILSALEKQPLWQNRFNNQQAYKEKGLLYGVGFALSNQAYGTSGDGMFGGISIEIDGSITVRTPYVDMGNGAATALGLAPSHFIGQNASSIKMGDAGYFDALNLTQTDTSSDKYVLKGSGSSSACLSAFQQYHAVQYAAMPLLVSAIAPAISSILNETITYDKISWKDGTAVVAGVAGRNIPWQKIVNAIFTLNLPTQAAIHATTIGEFAHADYKFSATKSLNLPIDYIALGTSEVTLSTVPRTNLVNPPSINSRFGRYAYSPCASLLSVTVDEKTGHVSVKECISALSAGVQHCPEIVSGQSQGGIAMAMGYALSEDCPSTNNGPGNGTWNLNKYRLMKSADIPKQELIIIEPAKNEKTARGIAESVMCPVPAAILNAIAMATGHRFTKLPVTQKLIKEALS
ncbi:xanthine dehydrogenase family protein molybdopterin-binding subunit [Shewanella surugensis]|uniref:Molybdopterin-dependent oxidoreductase n=1 Tax=Shewanella surugensis TaxID=212020 RepID=A0ABT0LIS7_9GAMM|nr:molybdopterin cofactor-binding domain-containing protein [Shewanella surugensis]MCL1127607.1 molybdopterin-dependent oxidoreductase [Shewanella surugensis]